MINNLNDDYVSVVTVNNNGAIYLVDSVRKLQHFLEANFKNYELLIVDNFSTDDSVSLLKANIANITIIELSSTHNIQEALTAGVDLAVGDFIFEVESVEKIDPLGMHKIFHMAKTGYDFVFLLSSKKNLKTRLFYRALSAVFANNRYSEYTSTIATVASRRGINKISDTGDRVIHRKVAYSLSGLKIGLIDSAIAMSSKRNILKDISLSLNTFIYYTNIMSAVSMAVSLFFLGISTFFILYSIYSYFSKNTVEGWASLILLSSFGFFGLFLMISIITKYLDQILHSSTKNKSYIYTSITKV